MSAFAESKGNRYERDERASLNTGLYCETVMKTRQLLVVPDALADKEWNANPDIKLGMISYMGVPVAWPNGEIFGTICVLDGRRNEYSELYRKLLFQCREMLQADLKSLQASTDLELKVLEQTAELRRSEVYLTEAQRLSRTGSFGWNVSSGEILWSEVGPDLGDNWGRDEIGAALPWGCGRGFRYRNRAAKC